MSYIVGQKVICDGERGVIREIMKVGDFRIYLIDRRSFGGTVSGYPGLLAWAIEDKITMVPPLEQLAEQS